MPAGRWSPNVLLARRLASRRPGDAPLVWAAAAAAVGFALEHGLAGWAPPSAVLFSGAILGLLAWLLIWCNKHDASACAVLLMTIAFAAAAWGAVAWRSFAQDELGRYARREAAPVCFEAVALAAPTLHQADPPSPFRAIPPSNRSTVEVRALRLRDGESWIDVSGRCELVVNEWLESISPGETIQVFGQLSRPDPQLNLGGRNPAGDARAERRLCTVWSEAPECVTTTQPAKDIQPMLAQSYASIRQHALSVFDARLDNAEAALAKAMILGDRSQLANETIETFRHTGMLHVLVVSGLHVGFVALLLPFAARLGLLPMRWALLLGVVLVIGYVVLVGGRPPATRAAVLACSASAAMLCRRNAVGANSLAAAALGVFAASPGAWLGVGAQLSFLAAATLLAVGRGLADREAIEPTPLERLIQRARPVWARVAHRFARRSMWGLMATAVLMLVTGPLVAARFHLIAPSALPLTIPTMLLVGGGVVSGLLLLACEATLSILPEVIGDLLIAAPAFCCQSLLAILHSLLSWVRQMPGASVYIAGPSLWWVAIWSLWIGAGWAIHTYWTRWRGIIWRLGLLVLALAFVAPLYRVLLAPVELRCSIIAVGHGSATLLQAPGGGVFLCDAGALGSPDVATDEISRALWAQGVYRLNGILLTHPDVDHYNALPGLLDRFAIGGVWGSSQMFPKYLDPEDQSGPAELKRLLIDRGVSIHQVEMGQQLRLGEAQLKVLHPTDVGVGGSDNANSVVLGVEYADWRLLLTGDLESPGLDFLLSDEPYDCDFLLAPHHGSVRSDPPGLAAWCKPEVVAISSGKPSPATKAAYKQAGAIALNTHFQGTICVQYSDKSAVLSSFR